MSTLALLALVLLQDSPPPAPELTHGPFLGHVSENEVYLWLRGNVPGAYTVNLTCGAENHGVGKAVLAGSEPCVSLAFTDLEPATECRYTVTLNGTEVATGTVTTADPDEREVRLAFASCVDERRFPEQPGWAAIQASDVDALCLLGDTPYIDSTDLEIQRRRYREFFAIEGLAELLRSVPLYATWDDHDFGQNDTDGMLPGRVDSRRAFLEFHAGPSFGEGSEGIYSSFRRGPVEVFLIDARWFAGRHPSHIASGTPGLLGEAQWQWLTSKLEASDATFKLLCTGMIWNAATRPGKTDHWGTYIAERNALFRWIGEHDISGVVLVAGDIHRSRVIRHNTTRRVGYELVELISSPLANTIIEAANAPHRGLEWDAGIPDSFLLVETVEQEAGLELRARFMDSKGEQHHEVRLPESALRK